MNDIDFEKVGTHIAAVGCEIILPAWKNGHSLSVRKKKIAEANENSCLADYAGIVTDADGQAEKALCAGLMQMLPSSVCLGEEAYAQNPSLSNLFRGDAPIWIIDPIDGTLPFSKGQEAFGTIVSLVYKMEIIGGWIYHPVTGNLLTAQTGGGAYLNGCKLRVLERKSLEQMVGVLGMDLIGKRDFLSAQNGAPSFDAQNYICCCSPLVLLTDMELFPSIGGKQQHFRVSRTHLTPWDDAAGVLAIREAGGEAMNWRGDKYRPDMFHTGIVAAPSLDACDELRQWISNVLGENS